MNPLWHGHLARVKKQSWAGRPCHLSSRSRQERKISPGEDTGPTNGQYFRLGLDFSCLIYPVSEFGGSKQDTTGRMENYPMNWASRPYPVNPAVSIL
jgi:hypothetical protein